MATPKQDNRLLVDVIPDRYGSDTFHIEARPVRIEDGHVRNISAASYDPDPLADLVISALGQMKPDDSSFGEQPYGWSVGYHEPFRVDVRRADAMAKLLRKVERGLEKAITELGYPESFASYVTRVAKLLGISTYGYRDADSRGVWHDDHEYHWIDAPGLQYRITDEIKRVRGPVGAGR